MTKTVIWTGCTGCGSNSTHHNPETGANWWYLTPEGYLCRRCYKRLIVNPKFAQRTGEWSKTHRIRFTPDEKRKIQVYDSIPLRIGVCEGCGSSIASGEISKTDLHHLAYDTSNPLAHTIELCVRCHTQLHQSAANRKVST